MWFHVEHVRKRTQPMKIFYHCEADVSHFQSRRIIGSITSYSYDFSTARQSALDDALH